MKDPKPLVNALDAYFSLGEDHKTIFRALLLHNKEQVTTTAKPARKMRKGVQRRRWTKEEIDTAKAGEKAGYSIKKIARMVKRTPKAVFLKLREL